MVEEIDQLTEIYGKNYRVTAFAVLPHLTSASSAVKNSFPGFPHD
jgi:hypothetical protein